MILFLLHTPGGFFLQIYNVTNTTRNSRNVAQLMWEACTTAVHKLIEYR